MKKHKTIRFFMVALVVLMQLAFLALIAKSHYTSNSFIALLSIIIITITLLLGYRYVDLHHDAFSYEGFSVAIYVPLGAVLCYELTIHSDLGSVLSAGITGSLASFIPSINKQSNYLKKLPPAIYCGAFVGMSSVAVMPSVSFVVIAGSVSGILFLLSKNLFVGIGGKLGTLAFGGVLIVSLINWLVVS